MSRILCPHHPPCHLIDLIDSPYPLAGFGELGDMELLVNQYDRTIKLVMFEPDESLKAGWKLGVLAHERDNPPSTETLSRLYSELCTLEMALSSPEFMSEIKKHRSPANKGEI